MRGLRWQSEILKGIAVAAAGGALVPVAARLLGSFDSHPWRVTAVLLPLAVAVWLLGRPLHRDRRVLLGGGFLGFFVAYCALFALAAGTDVLAGRRTELQGYEAAVPRNWLGLNRLGDWHYWLAPPAQPAGDLLVVTLPSLAGVPREEARRQFARLIHQAVASEAKGIAFDYYLEAPSQVDWLVCRELEAARQAAPPVPVLFGYRHTEHEGRVIRQPLPPSLEGCLPREQLGSLAGYLEADGRVRMVPLYLRGDRQLESLSLKAAGLLTDRPRLDLPSSGLLQFLRPRNAPEPLSGWPTPDDFELFRDRFVFVGSAQDSDVHPTPYGPLPGAEIHAWATHALRTGTFLERLGPAWTFFLIFALSYVLTLLQAQGASRRRLLLTAALLSVAVIVAAVLAIRFTHLWVDVAYPLVAVWGLTGLLAGGSVLQAARLRRLGPKREPAIEEAEADEAEGEEIEGRELFDVFLSHNSRDKPDVRRLADALEARGLRTWLDERELTPGQAWQEALEEVIEAVRSAAILVGPAGIGPWQSPEMRACLSECVDRNLPVIPVLLPGAPEKPELPLFLKRFTWVDLRSGLSPEGLDRVVWGITGVKPRRGGRPAAD